MSLFLFASKACKSAAVRCAALSAIDSGAALVKTGSAAPGAVVSTPG